MPVSEQTPEIAYTGNGVTTVFAYPFKIFSANDLTVRIDGTLAVLNVDYTVSGVGVEAGGNVTFSVAPGNGAYVAIQRRVPLSRDVEYQYSGDFQSPTVNRDFDRLWMGVQDINQDGVRSLRFPIGDTASTILPPQSDRALRGMAFDASGNAVAAPSSDASSLAVMLADDLTNDNGAALVGFAEPNAYPAGTVGDRLRAYADYANVSRGAALLGFKPSFSGAVGRPLAQRLEDAVSAKDFGLSTSNSGAQNVTAWNAAIAYAIAQGGLTLHIPRGTYDFNGTISFTGANNLRVVGDGPDATKLRITTATGDFLAASGSTLYTSFEDFTLTSSVTRTAGAMFNGGFWRRALMHRVKITEHFDGINLPGFEQATLSEVYIVKPSGAGVSIICGIAAATNQGANLNLLNCFGRGNNELLNDTPKSLYALLLRDVEAIFCVNSDFANYLNQIMVVDPQTRVANCHFLQTYFDGTWNGDNVLIQGSGIKQQFQFTGCWFNGAGNAGPGTNDCMGINALGAGEYYDWNFSGCRWLSTKGSAVYSTSRYLDFTFAGCVFTNCGFGSGTYKNAVHFQPSGASFKSPVITGCKFQDSGAKDIRVETNANGVVITGNNLESGIFVASGTRLGGCAGNWDQTASASVASASSIVVPHTIDYVVITGTTTINAVQPTFPGHKMSFRTTGALTWADDGGNLRLNGNYVTTGNSVLTLVCEANGDWREVARCTS